ncbi:hypothetical protein GIB67_020138 [Kingdonia uniflora]|uniref:BRCA1-associated protein n=1 Tax=Kingdonia uniflora TaxID=39325 RepID=A0A7J7NI49_9MAGN|nr:hypothetical protein GIB67_020138 [Kingdonia uniflora]
MGQGLKTEAKVVEVCHVHFAVDVQYTGSIEHEQSSPATSTEQPTCPVCLERLDQDMGGILTTICNHSFHCSCISKWTDSSCPVCRYCQQQPEKSICSVCETSENLWMCVICGFVGCGRYKEGHAIMHWKETEHCYSLEMETQRVWDYAGDNYVHRLIQSKTDGKLIELNSHCIHTDGNYGSCECCGDAILNEYNELLTSQLDTQRMCLESRVLEYKEEVEKEISEAVQKAVNVKVQKWQAKLNKSVEEKKFIDDIYENLTKNEEIWKSKILEVGEREKKVLRLKDEKIYKLETQLKDLMTCLESDNAAEQQQTTSSEIKNVEVLQSPLDTSSTSGNNDKHATKSNNRRKG